MSSVGCASVCVPKIAIFPISVLDLALQMLVDGFFNADPHAGNLLVKENGELVYIDFGMMSYLADTQVRTHTLLSGTHTIPTLSSPHTITSCCAGACSATP